MGGGSRESRQREQHIQNSAVERSLTFNVLKGVQCGHRVWSRAGRWRTRAEAGGQLGHTITLTQAVVQTLVSVPRATGDMESTKEWRMCHGEQHLGGTEVDRFKRDLGDKRRRVSTKLGHRIVPERLTRSCWLSFALRSSLVLLSAWEPGLCGP